MKKTLNSKLKNFLTAIVIGAVISPTVLFLGAKAAYDAYPMHGDPKAPLIDSRSLEPLSLASYSPSNFVQSENTCSVSEDQTVVVWKSTYWARCRMFFEGICVWPIPHKHMTYKVTVNDATPLRDRFGNAIPAISGEKRRDWLTYDSTSWNALQYDPRRKDRYLDYEPIASNEYVVMVETRYRLLNNVESTLGICIQQP